MQQQLKRLKLPARSDKSFWETKIGEVQTLTWGVPVPSRQAKHIVEGVSQVFVRFKSMGIPILRVHSDRACEFLSSEYKRWARSHDLFRTYTAGDEPSGNARIEREIGILKGRVRLLLRANKMGVYRWPLAARQAAEERFRYQLDKLGVPSPALIPFGTTAVAKRKTLFNRSQPGYMPRTSFRYELNQSRLFPTNQ